MADPQLVARVEAAYDEARAGTEVPCWAKLGDAERGVLVKMYQQVLLAAQDAAIPPTDYSDTEVIALLKGDALNYLHADALKAFLAELMRELLELQDNAGKPPLSADAINSMEEEELRDWVRHYARKLLEERGVRYEP